MASKPKKLDKLAAKTLLDGMIADARSHDDSDRVGRRENALNYQAGRMPDLTAEDGKSAVVEQILADTMGMLQPSLMRVFLSSDKIAIYDPVPPSYTPGMSQDEFRAECRKVQDFADQATDYVNFCFLRDCDGEKLLRDAIYDGLLHGNGIIKHWWDKTPKFEVESYTGLTDDEYLELVTDDDVEVLDHSERPQEPDESAPSLPPVAGGAGAPAVPPANPPGLNPAGGNPVQPVAGGPGLPPQPGSGVFPGAQPVQAPPPMPMAPGGMAGGPLPGTPGPQGAPIGPSAGVNGVPAGLPTGAPVGFGLPALINSIPGIGGNFPPPPMLHDVKIRRTVSKGRLRVKALPNEDFLIESGATALNEDECRFCAHRDTPTRSDLVERGYDQDLVWELPATTESAEKSIRSERLFSANESYEDKAGERVEVFECYALLDLEGDGIATWHYAVIGGNGGSSNLLEISEWGGRFPFSDIVPDPVPHCWDGRSLYDRLRDPQRVATAFSRRLNDNLYLAVEPQRAVNMSMIENPDALFDVRLGSHVRVKGDPRAAIADLAVPFVAKDAQPLIEEQRRIAERRTGVGEQSQGLDADALSGQVATAVAATQSGSALRKEDYARNIARGLRRVFSCLLRLMVENQDRERMILLRKRWVPMAPRSWSADMDVMINVGLGAGNRDRDLAMLQGIAGKQEMILQVLGPDNPLLGIKEYFNTLQMMVEASGVKSPERFFPDPSDAVMAQLKQMAAQKAQAPDPKHAAAMGQLQIAQAKAQADGQLAQQKAQQDAQLQAAKAQQAVQVAQAKQAAEAQLAQAEMQHRMEMDRAKAQQDLITAQQKAEAEIRVQQAKHEMQLEMQRQKAAADLHLRTIELQYEAQLKAQQQAADINRQSATNLEMPQ